MLELSKVILGKIYATVGHNWLTVKLSQILDKTVTKKQREMLKCLNR